MPENPVKVHFGNGTFNDLPQILKNFNPKTILLVLGEKSFRQSIHFQKLGGMLEKYKVVESIAVPQNPRQEFIEAEINRLKEISFDLVVAIGGGSVIDVSKILACVPRQLETKLDFYFDSGFPLTAAPAPVIAVPTTSGTGSEVTPYSSIETREFKKVSLGGPHFYPAVALVDPELTYTMPEYVTACTGFDALSQAIESFWAVAATPSSRIHALRGLEMILSGLEKACAEPGNKDARYAMAIGSNEAGLAIAQTKTTAVHSVSYPITALFGVAHGHACALTLAPFMRFNAEVLKEKGAPMLKIFKADSYEAAAKKIETLMREVKLENSLSKLGITEKGMASIVRDGFRPDRVLNNPRKLDQNDLEKILASIR